MLGPVTRECRSCSYRMFFNPTLAVGVFLLDTERRVLLMQRAHEPAKGKWAMPGGFVDPGECLEDAVRRETLEEVGLRIETPHYLASHPNLYFHSGVARHVTDIFFLGRLPEDQEVVLEDGEGVDWRRIPLADVAPADLAFDSMRHALALLRDRLAAETH